MPPSPAGGGDERFVRVFSVLAGAVPVLWFGLLGVAGCGSVEVPKQLYYRLEAPEPPKATIPRAGVLRVGGLELAADLAGDRVMVAENAVQVAPFVHHHWAGPLDGLLADVLVTGLRRAGWFERVKDPMAGGGEDWVLSGRVLDFQLAPGEDGRWVGRATIDLELVDRQGALVFRDEFQRDVPAEGTDAAHVVHALSQSVAGILTDFGTRCERAGVFDKPFAASPWR